MSEEKTLHLAACGRLADGYHFFDNLAATSELHFQNYRKVVFDSDFIALKESIADHGIRVPVQVSYQPSKGVLRVLSGERRVRAVEQIRLESPDLEVRIPILLRVCEDSPEKELDLTVTSVVANLMAKDLTQVDKMRCYKALLATGMSKKEIARCCGKDRKTVERSLELAQFDEEALGFIEEHEKSGLLKARNVEIIGQKLRNALIEAKKDSLPDDVEELSSKEIKEKIQEMPLPEAKEYEIRNSAFRVLQEEVRRREEAKLPKSEAEKIAVRELRENRRLIDIREVRLALEMSFDEEEIGRVLAVLNRLNLEAKGPTSTEQVQEDFKNYGDISPLQ